MRTSVPSTHFLPGGRRIRLRLPQANDRIALARLAERVDGAAPDLEAMLRFDPRRRTVLCAGAWIGGARMVVGIVACDRATGAAPDVLLADEVLAPGIGALLAEVLASDHAARERFAA